MMIVSFVWVLLEGLLYCRCPFSKALSPSYQPRSKLFLHYNFGNNFSGMLSPDSFHGNVTKIREYEERELCRLSKMTMHHHETS